MTPGWLLLLAIIAVILIVWGRRTREQAGLPVGDIVYADAARWDRVTRPLFSSRLQLTGKPDYVVRQRNAIIPVEVKSGYTPRQGPYDSHIYQLAAYCLLVHEHYGVRPSHGLIQYADGAFTVDYSPELERQLLALLDEMRVVATAPEVACSHNQAARCRGCGFYDVCDQSLV